MTSALPLSKGRRNIFTQHLTKQTHVDQEVAKYLQTLERPTFEEVKELTANWEATRQKYKDIAHKFIIDNDYPEDIDEQHLATEVELYLFVVLLRPRDFPPCGLDDNF
eukprot:Phypoly_transcript_31149.p1 GENE.Phypoly_transcript_31149~~Phypoly_transcript_31149.p1  ORF type:complete len:108 (+),score=14.38 Phypoly_transcript_31149:67-390(+)